MPAARATTKPGVRGEEETEMAVKFELDHHIATVTINRPERLNAMDGATYAELSEAWQRIRDDRDIRVAIITGAGERSFSAGADLKSFVPSPGDRKSVV